MQGRHRKLTRRWVIAGLAAAAMPGLVTHGARADTYREIFYQSGSLRIAGYLYQPAGPGRFPAIIYNHGSREGFERQPVPWVRIAAFYVDAGYAVLVPERRGYGKSDGPTWTDEVGRDTTSRFIARCQAEADDVLAAVDFLRTVSFVDDLRLGIVGWSLGGIATLFAVARSQNFRAAVDQAGGVLTWRRSPALQSALAEAVRAATCPMLMMDAENDAAPEAIPSLAKIMASAGLPHRAVIYPPYMPSRPVSVAPGHALFEAEGIPIWGKDAIAFFDSYLKG